MFFRMENQTSEMDNNNNKHANKQKGAFTSFVIHSLELTAAACFASGYNGHQGRILSHLTVFYLFKIFKKKIWHHDYIMWCDYNLS